MQILKQVKDLFLKLINLNDSPHGIALGFSIGLFLSILPTFGIGMIIALALCPLIKTNPVSTYIGTLIVNPFNGIFIYSFNYWVGTLIIKTNSVFKIPKSFQELSNISQQLVIGSFITAILSSTTFYFLIKQIVKLTQTKK